MATPPLALQLNDAATRARLMLDRRTAILVVCVVSETAITGLSNVVAAALHRLVGDAAIFDLAEPDESTVTLTIGGEHVESDPSGSALALALEADVTAALWAAGHHTATTGVASAGRAVTWERRTEELWQRRIDELRVDAVRQAEDSSFRRALALLLERGGIRTLYQPIVSATSGRTVGYEGLSRGPAAHRWEAPDVLLDAAERSGMGSLVQWEMVRLVRQRAVERLTASDRLLFINAPDMRYWLDGTPAASADDPTAWPWERVVVEVSERSPMLTLPDVWAVRDRALARGVQFALDDVGAGYAGLAALALLAPRYVKIDMGLVRDCHRDATKQAVIGALVQFARQTGATVIAEGVETPEAVNGSETPRAKNY
jgi:EAL domain-containing protein (putative c-di-GMP-specific phosphodiesterase class I)